MLIGSTLTWTVGAQAQRCLDAGASVEGVVVDEEGVVEQLQHRRHPDGANFRMPLLLELANLPDADVVTLAQQGRDLADQDGAGAEMQGGDLVELRSGRRVFGRELFEQPGLARDGRVIVPGRPGDRDADDLAVVLHQEVVGDAVCRKRVKTTF